MDELRKTIRTILLENERDGNYKKLLSFLDSYDLGFVEQGIELCLALGLGEVVKHVIRKGGRGGFGGCTHIFTMKLTRPFNEFFLQLFQFNRGMSPNKNIFQEDPYQNNLKIEIFAQDPSESWKEVTGGDRTINQIEMPLSM